jgi:sialic acid synthase SpsE
MAIRMKKSFEINNKTLSNEAQPYIICEMACAHNGSFDEAKALIDAAADAKADAIQFQFFVPEETVTPQHPAFSVIKDICFSKEQWKELTEHARSLKLDVFTCTYDVPSVQLAVDLKLDGIKLNSSDLSNPEVLQACAKSGLPLTLGTGASTAEEILDGIKVLKENSCTKLVLMHGVQNFPTQIEDLNIHRIDWLKSAFPNVPVGYADHTEGGNSFGLCVDLLAVSKGVAVLEKHITLDRSKKGIDYQAALEPKEWVEYVNNVRSAYSALGTKGVKPMSESDLKYRKFQKKSIVAAKQLSKGQKLTRADVNFIRNEEPGLAPKEFVRIDGMELKREINEFENIEIKDLL